MIRTLFAAASAVALAAPALGQTLDPAILDDPARPAGERAQDADRRVLEVYEFWGIAPGMTVADVFPGEGYNTHVLSRAVGPEGKVYGVLGFYEGLSFDEGEPPYDQRYRERVAAAALENVEIVSDLADVPEASVDVAVLVRNYHDVGWVFEGTSRVETVQALWNMLKPGGVVGIVEVATDREGWDAETHRLNEAVVIDDFATGNFDLAARSDMLANPDDDHSTTGFEAGRHTMDRYLLEFVKPAE